MALTKEQKSMFSKHIRAKVFAPRCPFCAGTELAIGDHLVAALRMEGDAVEGHNPAPLVQFICMSCYHVMHFAAVPLGLG